jgi:HSP20 family protein
MKKYLNGGYPTTLGSLFNTVFDEFDTILKPTVYFNDWAPVKYEKFNEDDKEINLELDIPGFEKEDINIEFKEQDHSGYHRVLVTAKNSKREFNRTILTPTNFESDKIEASYRNGVLKISAPRSTKSKSTKSIKITD